MCIKAADLAGSEDLWTLKACQQTESVEVGMC